MKNHVWEIKYKGYNTRIIDGRSVTLPAIKTLSVTKDFEVGLIEIPERNCFVGQVVTPEDFEKKLLICDVADKRVRDALLEKFYAQYKALLISKANNNPSSIQQIEAKISSEFNADVARLDARHGQSLTSEC